MDARRAAAFLAGFWIALTIAEQPLQALVSDANHLRDRVNLVRRAHELIPLRESAALAEVARLHALEMLRLGYLNHVNPAGLNPLDRVQAAGVTGFRLLAENIAETSVSREPISAVVEGWMQSPIHRENVLNPASNTTGIGVVSGPDGRTIVVQLFATF